MKKSITIYEIAAECNVSASTVSRVLNGNEHVSKRTLDKVNAVIEKYQYTPSSVARAMTINQTNTLGVIMPDIMNPYFSSLFFEIERYALDKQYSIILSNTLYGGSSHGISSPFSESEYFDSMLSREVDGVLVVGGQVDREEISDVYIEELNRMNRRIPVVVIGQSIPGCDCMFINRELGGGVKALVRHLAALGNERIGFVGGEVGVKQTIARVNAYQEAMDELGLPYNENSISLTNYYFKDGYIGMMGILDRATPRPTAVVAINDTVAIGAMRAIFDIGKKVPEDIAVVSCDQFPGSEFAMPRLTTLDQQNDYIGRLSIMMLLGAINGEKTQISTEHKPQLIIRESCGSQLYRRRT